MKSTVLLCALAAIAAGFAAPVLAQPSSLAIALDAHTVDTQIDRRKKRVKGGSGCDSARDIIEHPECR
jgi:hypothetical protein